MKLFQSKNKIVIKSSNGFFKMYKCGELTKAVVVRNGERICALKGIKHWWPTDAKRAKYRARYYAKLWLLDQPK